MSSSQTSAFLFQDMFTTTDVDRDGKKFDRGTFNNTGTVSRLTARSSNYDMDLTLDVNIDLLPITPQTTFTLALTSSLLPEGEKETAGGWRAGIEGGIADEWEYVYKFDQDTQERVTAYASFGGLLMALSGSYRHVSNVTVGENVYLLLRR
ncbi:BZ3500_MvSof-1268-A1-R1_Chr1-3g02205 [Microbotryum saponariae]|uniref:DNA-directed RNA polymerases I, II, and III subunit RPABC3 n=1 Tax=Microbotryum saponariae TaxID=289078 RepID=A0A2X0KP68_9BASI|nr:BZ3500_MvSof-1268-A1-R1_Chr1-3g02205 [Microbotryum saponariae]SCZ95649.1 BZ3501_MvSof-1269-A2-R1_Chr1-3g01808 [Microbotryum saponariae]